MGMLLLHLALSPPPLPPSSLRHAVPRMNQFSLEGRSSPGSVRNRRAELLRQLEAPIAPVAPVGRPEDDASAPLALAAARAADARKAKDITALRVGHLTSATSFFVTAVGGSKAQIGAIVKHVEEEVERQYGRKAHRQGKALSGWVCLDYDEVVVHVFAEKQRDFYGIEKFWAAGQPLDLSGVLVPNSEAAAEAVEEAAADEWSFGAEDDWELSEDEWRVAVPEPSAGSSPPAAATPDDAPPFSSAADSELFARLGQLDDLPRAYEAELEEAEESDAVAFNDEEEDADWALGDEQLREMISRIESSLELEAPEEDESQDDASGWRRMMMEDGWELDEQGELKEQIVDATNDDDDEEEE
ncbi:hypothetical protein AB1Y20_011833 [Prymnesium parvum]|uniref:Ribosome silencing factor n=1 Tax=Prymnesium parvum TaxID=97485 RepID=A0AB34IJJ9_PRYPA